MQTDPAPVVIEPEVLEAGPGTGRPRNRFALPVGLGVVGLLVAALLVWQLWPRPVAPLSLAELQGIYAGMVRGDGTNDASLLQRNTSDERRSVEPVECLPLFDTTALDRFPEDATDGVGTFWMAERVGTSLLTFRFADAETAIATYDRIAAALRSCTDRPVRLDERRVRTVTVHPTPVTLTSGIDDQLGYQYSPSPYTRFAVHVLRYENLLTWQFRYDTADGEYSPLPAQQVMDSLVAQMTSVVELRP